MITAGAGGGGGGGGGGGAAGAPPPPPSPPSAHGAAGAPAATSDVYVASPRSLLRLRRPSSGSAPASPAATPEHTALSAHTGVLRPRAPSSSSASSSSAAPSQPPPTGAPHASVSASPLRSQQHARRRLAVPASPVLSAGGAAPAAAPAPEHPHSPAYATADAPLLLPPAAAAAVDDDNDFADAVHIVGPAAVAAPSVAAPAASLDAWRAMIGVLQRVRTLEAELAALRRAPAAAGDVDASAAVLARMDATTAVRLEERAGRAEEAERVARHEVARLTAQMAAMQRSNDTERAAAELARTQAATFEHERVALAEQVTQLQRTVEDLLAVQAAMPAPAPAPSPVPVPAPAPAPESPSDERRQLAAAGEAADKLRAELHAERERAAQAHERMHAVRDELQGALRSQALSHDSLAAECAALRERVADVSERLVASEARVRELSDALAVAEARVDVDVRDAVAARQLGERALRSQIDAMRDERDAARAAEAECREQLQAAARQATALRSELGAVHERLHDAERDVQRNVTARAELASLLDSERTQRQRAAQELDATRQELAAQRRALADARTRLDASERTVADLRAVAERDTRARQQTERSEVVDLAHRIAELQQGILDEKARVRQLNDRVAELAEAQQWLEALRKWLTQYGMQAYYADFCAAQVTLELLLSLSDAQLRRIGVANRTDRTVLLAAIDSYRVALERMRANPAQSP